MNETTIVWLVAVASVITIFVPYFFKFRRDQRLALKRREEALILGSNRVAGQYPMVDRSLCIGCGSCASACPEGDVLAVVWGAAEVVNGQRCVGHGYCEVACPVGALKVGLGDIKTRPDIPILSECNETSVHGLFIAGELSGISLIRHALAQGEKVAGEIAARLKAAGQNDGVNDIVIVGAGPAGLGVALTARKLDFVCTVLDQYGLGGTILHYPRRKLVMTQPVEVPMYGRLDRDEYSKEELLEILQTACDRNQIRVRSGERLVGLERRDNVFHLSTESGSIVSGRYVVLALGRRGSPRRLQVPGEDLSKVMYQLTDAQAYTNKHILVVGGGDSAVEAAIGLARQPGNTVSVSYRKSRFFRIKKKNEDRISRLIEKNEVYAYFDSLVKLIDNSSVILSTGSREIELPNDYVLVQIGGTPPYDMLKSFGIEFGGEASTIAEQDERLQPGTKQPA